jgi:hypothetical protein
MSQRRSLLTLRTYGLVLAFSALSRIGAADVPAPPTQSRPHAATPAQPDPPLNVELPSLQPGMWEYQRSVTSTTHQSPAEAKISKCSDPSEEMRSKRAELQQKGCRFSPTIHTGNNYRASWTCPTHGGVVAMSQVITVSGDNRYEDMNEARFQEQVSRTRIVATRIGECPLIPGVPKQRHRPPPVPSSSSPSSGGG